MVDLSRAAIEARLREVSRLAEPLTAATRLGTKIDLGGAAIAARLKEASDLLDLCRQLASAGRLPGRSPRR